MIKLLFTPESAPRSAVTKPGTTAAISFRSDSPLSLIVCPLTAVMLYGTSSVD